METLLGTSDSGLPSLGGSGASGGIMDEIEDDSIELPPVEPFVTDPNSRIALARVTAGPVVTTIYLRGDGVIETDPQDSDLFSYDSGRSYRVQTPGGRIVIVGA